MTEEELINLVDNQNRESADFKRGFRAGTEYKDQMENGYAILNQCCLSLLGMKTSGCLQKRA
ncbi:hypothetical protein P8813_14330 [Bacillus velezensis]|uniref:hypothetical protein n=1 Tax=Bacillus velezensis TaxID=492670 RepID=UPI002DB9FE34|nr:hypothetical protein [Bacillus velezensis]MEC0384263.1 hypothetical protein [Bacillus velezensis]